MKSLEIAALTLMLLVGGQGEGHQAETRLAHHRLAGTESANWREEQCRFGQLDGKGGFSDWEVLRTIGCAVAHWYVDGGTTKAVAVARCESGLNEWAMSSSGTYLGLFQHSRFYWPGRFADLAPPWWRLRSSPFNARSNAIVSIRMAHGAGWGAWSCA